MIALGLCLSICLDVLMDCDLYMVDAYCVKCNGMKKIKKPKPVVLKNGKAATAGVCPTCGTKLYRMGPLVSASC